MKPQSATGSNIAWVSIGNGVTLVVGFASSIMLARWLGAEARGLYALIVATSMTVAAILGNSAWVQAHAFLAGKKRYSPAQIAGHGLIISLGCSAIMSFLLICVPSQVLESLFPELTTLHLWIIVFITTSTLIFVTLRGLLLGLDNIPLITSIGVFKAVAALFLQLILIRVLDLGLGGALWELILSGLLAVFITMGVLTRKTGLDLRVQPRCVKDIFTYGGKSYPGHVGVILLSRLDIYFVALFAGATAAGLYAVGKGVAEIVAIIEQSISQAVIPKAITGDSNAAAAVVSRAFRASFWLSGFVLLGGGLLARWLIPLLYGAEYAGAAPAFLLLSPGVLLLTTRTLGTYFSMQLGRPEIPTYYVLASGIASVPLSYVLTRQFGYLGAATAFSLVAVLRGVAAIALFMIFSKIELKIVLLPTKADLLWLPQRILSWLGRQNPQKHEVQA
ncbi:MAG: oligosaccharide flippase family protein [Anaerolineales bacterium]|nr:oligosaccharide flippase family protein [Anaerolineales bacterium]